MNKNILKYENLEPTIGNDVYIAPGAFVIGAVSLGDNSNIWFNTVLRGDIEKIKVGKFTNIQDNSTVHVMGDCPAIIGDYVTVGVFLEERVLERRALNRVHSGLFSFQS